MSNYQHILVPIDGSPRSEDAILKARDLAGAFSSRVTLLTAYDIHQALFLGQKGNLPTELGRLKEHQREQISFYLESRRELLRGLETTLEVIEEDPADAIVDRCKRGDVDLVVMNSHGRRGFSRWLSGSVTESVMRRINCPILVLRHDRQKR